MRIEGLLLCLFPQKPVPSPIYQTGEVPYMLLLHIEMYFWVTEGHWLFVLFAHHHLCVCGWSCIFG
jgi:hypothetical protein